MHLRTQGTYSLRFGKTTITFISIVTAGSTDKHCYSIKFATCQEQLAVFSSGYIWQLKIF